MRCSSRVNSGAAKEKAGTEPGLFETSACNDGQLTASLRPLPAENFGTVRAGIFTSAPVCGLRPVDAARFDTVKLPKPTRRTSPPFFSSPVITENTASTADCASPLETLRRVGDGGHQFVLVHKTSLP